MAESKSEHLRADGLLEARGIGKEFPGVKALDGVAITVRRGRLNALLGENGAGKSTLMNILAGVFPPDEGEILFDGHSIRFKNPREAQEAGISIIFQELNLIPHLSVAENVFLGREPLTPFGLIDFARMNRDAKVLLAELELDIDPRTPVARLRVGAQQVVEIAKAISFRSRVIIMDEPTSAITEQEIEVLFRLIRQLKQQGVGIIYITHKLDELSQIADDVTILRDGRFIASEPFANLTRDRMIQLMVGRELSELFPKSTAPLAEEVLRVENVSLRHPDRADDFVVRDVSFRVRKGEVVGLFGLMGAGRTELLQTTFGLHPKTSAGTIHIAGEQRNIRSPQQAIDAGLALAPEDRKLDGLVLSMNVVENVSLASLNQTVRAGLLQPRREREVVSHYLERLAVKTPSLQQQVRNLSGGNQQKVVLAKWLATRPKVLLLDEPTRGIDINAKKEIYAIIDELARSGLGVVMVSSELPEILAIADRILVLAEGRLTAEFARDEATEEMVLKAALPAARQQQVVNGMTGTNAKEHFARFQSLFALALMVVVLSLMSDNFLTLDNGLNVLRQISINLCLSIGMTMIILSGGIDLSVGSVLAFSGAVAAGLLKNGLPLPYTDSVLQFTVLGSIVGGIVVGGALGWFNGFMITRFRLPPFVATLGMLSIARGFTRLWTGGFPITDLGPEFTFMGIGYWLGVPMPVWFSTALVAVFVVITRRTRFGRYLYAVGGNERAAKLSGLNVARVKCLVYMLGGALAGVAGLLATARQNAADPKIGVGYELDSIAAVVIGGTSLSGGRGSILGTVLGCLIIGVLNNGLVLLGVSPDWQLVVKGVVILIAVAIDQLGRKEE